MKKIHVFLLMAIAGLLLISCGGEDTITLKASDKACPGGLSDYIELSDGDFTLKKLKGYKSLGGDRLFPMELTLTFNILDKPDLEHNPMICNPIMSFMIVDENGNSFNEDLVFSIHGGTQQDLLNRAFDSGAKTVTLTLKSEDYGGSPINQEQWDEILEKAKGVLILECRAHFNSNEDVTYVAVEEEKEEEEIEIDEPSTPNNPKADALLNKLEGMINRLAKMDDESSAYDVLEDQILDLMDKIDDLDMTDAQEKRYDKLESKFDKI